MDLANTCLFFSKSSCLPTCCGWLMSRCIGGFYYDMFPKERRLIYEIILNPLQLRASPPECISS